MLIVVAQNNVLLRNDGEAVLTDFGLSRSLGLDATQVSTSTGRAGNSRWYVSPSLPISVLAHNEG